MEKTCVICGAVYQAKSAKSKYCSEACKQRSKRGEKPSGATEPAESVKQTKRGDSQSGSQSSSYDYEYHLKRFTEMGIEPTEWLATNTGLDSLTKLPIGRIIEIFGKEGVGKTTLALNLIQNIKDQKILYIDTEATMNPQRMAKLNLDSNLVTLRKLEFAEDIYDEILHNYQQYGLIVVDSIANCSFRTEAEGDSLSANMGQKAKIFNKLMRLTPHKLRDNKTTLLLINQERETIGGYTTQIYTPGGTGIKYAASMRIRLTTTLGDRFPKNATNGEYKGQEVTAEIKKSKVSPPFRKGKFKLYYV